MIRTISPPIKKKHVYYDPAPPPNTNNNNNNSYYNKPKTATTLSTPTTIKATTPTTTNNSQNFPPEGAQPTTVFHQRIPHRTGVKCASNPGLPLSPVTLFVSRISDMTAMFTPGKRS